VYSFFLFSSSPLRGIRREQETQRNRENSNSSLWIAMVKIKERKKEAKYDLCVN
jgi:hypothetical protein